MCGDETQTTLQPTPTPTKQTPDARRDTPVVRRQHTVQLKQRTGRRTGIRCGTPWCCDVSSHGSRGGLQLHGFRSALVVYKAVQHREPQRFAALLRETGVALAQVDRFL